MDSPSVNSCWGVFVSTGGNRSCWGFVPTVAFRRVPVSCQQTDDCCCVVDEIGTVALLVTPVLLMGRQDVWIGMPWGSWPSSVDHQVIAVALIPIVSLVAAGRAAGTTCTTNSAGQERVVVIVALPAAVVGKQAVGHAAATTSSASPVAAIATGAAIAAAATAEALYDRHHITPSAALTTAAAVTPSTSVPRWTAETR